jgi:sugar phosphate permease
MGYSRDEVKAVLLGKIGLTKAKGEPDAAPLKGENIKTDVTSSNGVDGHGKNSIRLVSGLFFGYACFNFMRRSFPQQMPIIGQELNIPHSQLGLPNSVFAVAYAVSKFAGAIASDSVPCAECHVLGLVLCGLACAMLGLCNSLSSFVVVWSLQGLLQGFGWPTVVRIVVTSLPAHARSKYWGILSASGNVGKMLGPYGMALATAAGASWRLVFFGSGLFVMAAALPVAIMICSGKDGGSSIRDCKTEKVAETQEKSGSRFAVLRNPAIVALMVCNGLAYFVRNCVAEWGLVYTQSLRLAGSQMEATTLLFWMEVGGSFGAFFSGYLSSLMGSRHARTTLMAASLFSVSMYVILWSAYNCLDGPEAQAPVPFFLLCFLYAIGGAGLFSVVTMLGLHAATLAAAGNNVGMASACLETLGQVGCVVAGQPLGAFASVATFGRGDPASGWFSALALITLASTLIAAMHVPLIPFEENRLASDSATKKKAD